ncbi:tandem-95 repeat protein [Mariniblastus fucicola]|uniref:tandem-95 repeat protein n=1 Tax=Mariniblastus fucicola TaxID=980251 RepID=UPI0009467A48|nr:tandem-95 repeat protein [Mariniblastus fucicola]
MVTAYDAQSSDLELQSLEARVLYDASPLLAVAGENLEPNELDFDEIAELCFDESLAHPAAAADEVNECLVVDAHVFEESPAHVETMSRQLVVIDQRIDGFEALVKDITSDGDGSIAYDVLVVEENQSGIELISSYLNGLSTYGAVHIVGHGSQDRIQLGSEDLGSESLVQYETALKGWSQGLATNADILIYGCEVAASEEGQDLVDQISAITGADVAASDDLTGHESLDGDWEFEYIVGSIETDVVFSSVIQAEYRGTFATVTVDSTVDAVTGDTSSIANLIADDGGDGISLREAIIAANADSAADTIYLGSGVHALTLSGSGNSLGDLDIDTDVTIIGMSDGSTVIDASGMNDRVFQIGGATTTIEHITVTGGYTTSTSGGGGILVGSGATLILDQAVVTGNESTDKYGGIGSDGNLYISNSIISDNIAGASGGGIGVNAGIVTIYGTTVSGNEAGDDGGGLSLNGGIAVTVDATTFSGNAAGDDGGGVYVSSTDGAHSFTNVTVSSNDARRGGGFGISGGTTNVQHATVTGNWATTDGGGVYVATGDFVYGTSIIAGNDAVNSGQEVFGFVDGQGESIIGEDAMDSQGGAGYHVSDRLNQSGLSLGALSDNGGPVETHALLPGSVGIDEATTSSSTTDGRGFLLVDSSPDIGAFELGAADPMASSDNTAPTFVVSDGITTPDYGPGDDAVGETIELASGQLLAIGQTNDQLRIARHNPDGTLDTTFNGTGYLVASIGDSSVGYAVDEMDDGRFVVVGQTTTGGDSEALVVRFNADGSFDTSFDTDGIATFDSASDFDEFRDVAVLADGSVIAVGTGGFSSTSTSIALMKFLSNGSPDSSFGDGGTGLTFIVPASQSEGGLALAVQSDGKIIVGGSADDGGGTWDFYLSQRDTDGSAIQSLRIPILTGRVDNLKAIELTAGDDIVAVGQSVDGTDYQTALVKIDGSTFQLDASFGTGGIVVDPILDFAEDLVIDASGAIYVGGSNSVTADSDSAIVKFTSGGAVDTSFGTNGISEVAVSEGGADYGRDLLLKSDGSLLLSGEVGSSAHLVQMDASGNLDADFGPESSLDGNPEYAEGGASVVLDADVTVFDEELSGGDNFGGATLTLQRTGGANDEDIFSATGSLVFNSGNVELSSNVVGNLIQSRGQLQIVFLAGTTNDQVNEVMQSIAYSNSSGLPPANVDIEWTLDDGNEGSQGDGGPLSAVGTTSVTIDLGNNTRPTFFTGDGSAIVTLSGAYDNAVDVVVQPDGKYLVASAVNVATTGQDLDFAVSRFNTDGTLDATFGTDGTVITSVNTNNETINRMALQSDGKIIVVGGYRSGSTTDAIILRYTADGALDTTFNGDGMQEVQFVSNANDWFEDVVIQPDGKIVAVGYANYGGQDQMIAARFETNGTLDASFGTGGQVVLPVDVADEQASAVALQSDGKLILVGSSNNGADSDFAIRRLDVDGSLDTSFGNLGVVGIDISLSQDNGNALVIGGNDEIFVGGTSDASGNGDSVVIKLGADGNLDATFGTGGVASAAAGNPSETVSDLAIQDDGKVVAVGAAYNGSNNDVSVIRFNTDGTLDGTFGSGGLVRTAIGDATDAATSVVIDSQGSIIVAGRTDGFSGDTFVARYDSAGGLDGRFDVENTFDGTSTFVANGSPVVLDPDVEIFDDELSSIDDFGGATLLLQRSTGFNADDVFSGTGNLEFTGGAVELSSIRVGSVVQVLGQMYITFDAGVTNAQVNEVMQSIAYENTSTDPPGSVGIQWSFNDRNDGSQGSGGNLSTFDSKLVYILNPVVASVTAPNSVATDEDITLVYSGANVIQIDNGIASDTRLQVSLSVSSGSLTLAGTVGITIVDGADGTSGLVIEGLRSDINTALDGLQYDPVTDFNGADTLGISVSGAADLEGHYSFEGGSLEDQSIGSSEDGLPAGSPSIISDPQRGDVLDLNGTGQYVSIGSDFGQPPSLTLAAWINVDAGATDAEIISLGNNVGIRAENQLDSTGLTLFYSNGTDFSSVTTEEAIAGTGWRHVAVTFDDATDTQQIYLDGALVASGNDASSIAYDQGSTTVIGGHGDDSSAYDFAGQIDDARIYSRALAAEEIAALATDQTEASDSVAITIDPVNDAPTFSVPGKLAADWSSGDDAVYDSILDASGRTVVVGESDGDFVVARYNSDGSLDNTFGTNGLATYDENLNDRFTSVALQSDGKILAAGYEDDGGSQSGFALRFNTDGSLDTTFGSSGVISGLGSFEHITGVDERYDGRVVLVGGDSSGNLRVSVHATGGSQTQGQTISSALAPVDFQLLSDGKIVTLSQNSGGHFEITRLNGDLSLDTTFDGDGIRTVNFGGGDTPYSIALQTDGSYVLAGASGSDSLVMRIDSTGQLDNTFGTGGRLVGVGEADEVLDVQIASDGKIVLSTKDDAGYAIVRLNTDGTLDTTFDGDGVFRADPTGDDDLAHSISLATDGSIVVAGTSGTTSTDVFLSKLDSDGATNSIFGASSLDESPTFTEGGSVVVLDSDVSIFDTELSGIDDFGGATLTLQRVGGVDPDDGFNRTGDLFFTGSTFEVSGAQRGTYTYTPGRLVLTFDAGVTNAEVNEVMGLIGYRNFSDAPPSSVDIEWSFSDGNDGATQGDGSALTVVGTTTVNLIAVNDAPTIDLDGDDSTAVGIGFAATFDGVSPVRISDSDAILTDVDGVIQQMEVRIANIADGVDEVLSYSSGGTIGSSYTPSTGVIRFFNGGSATNADFLNALNTVTYENVAATPNTTQRIIEVVATDGTGYSLVATSLIDFADAATPSIDLNGAAAGLNSNVTFNEDGGFLQVAPDAVVTDFGESDVTQLVIEISGFGTDGASERISNGSGSFPWGTTLIGSDTFGGTTFRVDYDGDTTITITNSAGATVPMPEADLQLLVRSVNYQNTSQDPTAVNREFAFTATDSTGKTSAVAIASVAVVPANDAPVLSNAVVPAFTSITEDDIDNAGETVRDVLATAGDPITDADGDPEGIAIFVSDENSGTWEYSLDGGSNWSQVGTVNATSVLLLRDTDMLRLNPDGNSGGFSNIGFRAWDQTSGAAGDRVNPGSLGGTTAFSNDTLSAVISVANVDDAPEIDLNGAGAGLDHALNYSENDAATFVAPNVTVNDSGEGDIVSINLDAIGFQVTAASELLIFGGESVTGGVAAVGTVTVGGTTFVYNYDGGDALSFANDAGAGIPIPQADVQLLLRSLQYQNLGDDTVAADIEFEFSVADSGGQSSAYAVSVLTIDPVNDAPVLDVAGDSQLTGILQNDTDPSGDLVSAIIASAGGDPITDVDAGPVEGVAVTSVDNANGTWEYSIDGGTNWTAFVAVSDSSATVLGESANDLIRFVPDAGYSGSSMFTYRAWDTTDGNFSGASGVDASSNGGDTAFSTATETASIDIDPGVVKLILSTTDDVGPAYMNPQSDVAGLPSWSDGSVISMRDTGSLSFGENDTDGVFNLINNFDTFAADSDVDLTALHFVTNDATINGAGVFGGSIDLLAGDILFVTNAAESFSNTATGAPVGWSNNIASNAGDIYVFRAEVSEDYSSGYFRQVMVAPGSPVQAITLVENATLIGDTFVAAGDFLFSDSLSANDVFWYDISNDTSHLLVEGSDVNIEGPITGLELIESGTVVGGETLNSGSILVTLQTNDAAIGSNSVSVQQNDIASLEFTATTYGGGTAAANAAVFFDGDGNANFDDTSENVDAFSLIVTNSGGNVPPAMANSGTPVDFTEGSSPVIIDSTITVFDGDSSDFATGVIEVSFSSGGADGDRISIFNGGVGAGQIGLSGSDVTYEGVVIGSFSGGLSETDSLIISLNANADAVATQALLQNLTYHNISTTPATTVRTVDFVLTDGDGGISNIISKDVTITTVDAAPPIAVDDASGVVLDGIDDYVEIADSPELTMTNTMTMEAWIKSEASTNVNRMIINKEGEYEVAILADNRIYWGFANTDPGWSWHDTGYTVTNGEWTHVAVSYDNGTVTTYINGNVVEVYYGSGVIGDAHATLDSLRIGGRENNEADKFFNGVIDDVRIWNDVRTEAEILANYDTKLTGSETGLAGYWSLGDGTGSGIADLSSNGNDGTLIDGGAGTAPTRLGYVTDQNNLLNVDIAAGVLVNDYDADGDSLIVTHVNGDPANVGSTFALPAGARLTLNATGDFVYDPSGIYENLAAGEFATDTFTYEVNDGNGGSDTATVTVTINGLNDAPLLDNSGTMSLTDIDEDAANPAGDSVNSIIASAGGNPIDDIDDGAFEGIALTSFDNTNGVWQYKVLGGDAWSNTPSLGVGEALLLSPVSMLRFVPDANFSGSSGDIVFHAWDRSGADVAGDVVGVGGGGGSSAFSTETQTASLNVNSVNDAPEFVGTTSVATPFINEIHYDDIGDDDGEAIEIAAPAGTNLAGWTLVRYNGVSSTVYATDSLSGIVADQGNGFGTFVVNYPLNGLQNGSPDGVALVDDMGNVVQFLSWEGQFTANNGAAAGMTSVDIGVAESDLTTSEGTSMQLTDGGWVTEANSTFGAKNSGQDFALLNSDYALQTVAEEASLVFSTANGNAITIADNDANGAELSMSLQVANGTITLGSTSGLNSLIGNGSANITFTGTLTDINTALEGLVYVGDVNFDGTDQLTFTVDDQGNTGSGGNLTDVANVAVDVTPVNDAPTIDLDLDDSSGTTGTGFDTSFDAGGIPVPLTNGASLDDIDSTLQSLTVQIVNMQDGSLERLSYTNSGGLNVSYMVASGTLVFSNGGSATNADFQSVLNSIAYENQSATPDSTTRIVNFTANDGTDDSLIATANVAITGDAAPPTQTVNTGATLFEGNTYMFASTELQFADDQQNAGSVTYTVSAPPSHGSLQLFGITVSSFTQADIDAGNITYVHNGSETSSDSFTFVVDDGQGNASSTQTFDFTISPVNDLPIFGNLDGTPTYIEGGSPVVLDGDATVFDEELGNTFGDVYDGATLTLVRNGGASPNDAFSGSGTLAALVEGGVLTVDATDIGIVTTNSGGVLLLTFNANADQASIQSVMQQIQYEESSNSPPSNVQIDWVFDDGNTGAQGSGGAGQTTGSTSVTIQPINNSGITAPASSTTNEEVSYIYSGANVIQVDDGVAGDSVIEVSLSVANGSLDLSSTNGITFEAGSDGSSSMTLSGLESDINAALDGLSYTPTVDYVGSDSLNVVVGDTSGASGSYSFESGNANDQSGNNEDGVLVGSATTVSDATRGEVLSLDGSGAHVSIPSDLGVTSQVTIAAWVNLANADVNGSELVSFGDDLYLRLDQNGGGGAGIVGAYSDGVAMHNISSNVNIEGTGWRHVAFVVDSANNVQELYLDGVRIGMTTNIQDLVFSASEVRIGSPVTGATGFDLDGRVDDVRIYSSALTTAEINDLTTSASVASRSIAITVDPVNDAPVQTGGSVSNLTVNEDSGPTSLGLAGLTHGTGGGSDEAGQALTYQVTVVPSPTTGTIYLADGVTSVTTGFYTETQIQGMQFDPSTESINNTVTFFEFDVVDDGGTANGGADSRSHSMQITILPTNDAPTIDSLDGDSLVYLEDSGAVIIEQSGDVMVTDVDSVDFDGGTLTVSFNSGSDAAEDVLSVLNEGSAVGEIGFNAGTVTFGGTAIGTATGGSAGTQLQITLNANADANAVAALVERITFENTDTSSPTSGIRDVQFALTDGDGGISSTYSTSVEVLEQNDAPDLTEGIVGLTVSEGNGVIVFDGGTLTDVDSPDFDGGRLTISVTSTPDPSGHGLVLTGLGGVSTSGSDVLVGGVIVGSSNYPTGLQAPGVTGPVVIDFNSNATVADVEAIYQAIGIFNNSDDPVTGIRTIEAVVTDGDGGTSNVASKDVDFTSTNDAPVLDLDADDSSGAALAGDYDTTFAAGGSPVLITDGSVLSDVDGDSLSQLSIQISNLQDGAAESLLADLTGYPSFSQVYDSATGELRITSTTGSLADFQAVLETVVYDNTSTVPGLMERVIEVTATDQNAGSVTATSRIDIVPDSVSPNQISNTGSVVVEGGVDTITSAELQYADSLQSPTMLRFNVVTDPAYGHLAFASDATTPILSFTQAQIDSGDVVYVHDGSEIADDSFQFTVDDGAGNFSGVQTFDLAINLINDAPQISGLDGDVLNYAEGDGERVLDQLSDAVVTDADSADFDAGTLTVQLSGSDLSDDELSLLNQGTGPGQVGLDRNDVTWGGVVVGTFAGGQGGVPLTVTFNSLADADVVSSLVQAVTFENLNDVDPVEGARIATFELTDGDGATSVMHQVTINVSAVNDAPSAPNARASTNEDVGVAIELAANDIDGTVASFNLNNLPANGILYTDASATTPIAAGVDYAATGNLLSLYFVPDANWNGLTTFGFTATDDQGLDSSLAATATINVGAVNDAPMNQLPSTQSVQEDSVLVLSAANGNNISINDVDAFGGVIEVRLTATNGVLNLATTTGLTVSGDGSAMVTIEGSNADIYNALDGLQFVPNANFYGPASIEVATNDRGNTGGGDLTDVDVLNINVGSINDDPFNSGTFPSTVDVAEDVVSAINLASIDLQDVDANGGQLTLTLATSTGGELFATSGVPVGATGFVTVAGSGTSQLTLTGTIQDLNAYLDVDAISYLHPTADLNGAGQDVITVRINDNGNTGVGGGSDIDLGSADVDIAADNDAPTDTSPDSVLITENIDTTGGYVVATLMTSDVDAGETFTYLIVGGPDAGNFSINGNDLLIDDGVIDFETKDSYNVVVRAVDSGGLFHDETVLVSVVDINDAPVVENRAAIVNEGQNIVIDNVFLNTTDQEQIANELVYTIDSLPVNGTLYLDGSPVTIGDSFTQQAVNNGRVQYTHSGTSTTSDAFLFSVSDGQGETLVGQVFDVTINPVNDVPVVQSDAYTVSEDTAYSGMQVLSNDTDEDGDSLSVSVVSSPNRGGTVSVNPDGSFDYQPAQNYHGTETFQYEANDGNGGTSRAVVTVNILPVNDAPVVAQDFFQVIPGLPLISLEGVLQNDFDIENSALTAILLSSPVNGTLSFLDNGQFVYAPNAGFAGTDTFTYVASDGIASSATSVQITVAAVLTPTGSGPGTPIDPTNPVNPGSNNPLDPSSSGNNNGSSDEDDAESGEKGIFVLPKGRNVPVLDLQQTKGFQADGELDDLVLMMTDQDRAKAVLKVILQNIQDDDFGDSRSSEELDRINANSSFSTVFDAQFLFDQLDEIELNNSVIGDFEMTVGAITAFGTIGYVLWALRGGALVALALSQLPAWQMIDPLPILDGYSEGKKQPEKEDLEGFFAN